VRYGASQGSLAGPILGGFDFRQLLHQHLIYQSATSRAAGGLRFLHAKDSHDAYRSIPICPGTPRSRCHSSRSCSARPSPSHLRTPTARDSDDPRAVHRVRSAVPVLRAGPLNPHRNGTCAMPPFFDRPRDQHGDHNSPRPAARPRLRDLAAEFARPAPPGAWTVHTETDPWRIIDGHDVVPLLCDKSATVRRTDGAVLFRLVPDIAAARPSLMDGLISGVINTALGTDPTVATPTRPAGSGGRSNMMTHSHGLIKDAAGVTVARISGAGDAAQIELLPAGPLNKRLIAQRLHPSWSHTSGRWARCTTRSLMVAPPRAPVSSAGLGVNPLPSTSSPTCRQRDASAPDAATSAAGPSKSSTARFPLGGCLRCCGSQNSAAHCGRPRAISVCLACTDTPPCQ
jgi:hypothetical protein